MTRARDDLSTDYLRSVLDYDPETGELRWKPRPETNGRGTFNARFAGKLAGSLIKGYVDVQLGGKLRRAHRLIYKMQTGECPPYIDHINGIRSDNRWCNLRPATHTENGQNRGACKNNSSGRKGVSWCKIAKKWKAQIRIDGRKTPLGVFDCLEEAAEAYRQAALKYHGEFARTE